MAVPLTGSARWNLATCSDDGSMCSLVNLGSRPAIDVTVQLLEGPHERPNGTVVFGRIDPGSAVNMYRFSADLDLPRWDHVTVIWREACGWSTSRHLHYWDSESESAPSTCEQALAPIRRGVAITVCGRTVRWWQHHSQCRAQKVAIPGAGPARTRSRRH